MSCPFYAEAPTSACMVRLVDSSFCEGGSREKCSAPAGKEYRDCPHYEKLVWGGLVPIAQQTRRRRGRK